MKRILSKLTKDVASTLTGVIMGAATGAAGAYLQGGVPSKEVLIASAVMGVAGYFHNKGNTDPLVK